MIKNEQCKSCKSNIEESFHFCPICGEPLTQSGKEVLVGKMQIAQLQLLNGLTDVIEDEKTLSLINKIAKKIAQES